MVTCGVPFLATWCAAVRATAVTTLFRKGRDPPNRLRRSEHVLARSPLPIGREDVVLRRHSRMAGEPAIDSPGLVRCKLVRCRVVIKHGVCPALRVRESLAVLLDEKYVLQTLRNPHVERSLRALLRLPLDFCDL